MAVTTLAVMINCDDDDDNDDDRDGKSSSFLKFQLTCRAPLPARPPIQTSARFYSRDRRLFLQNSQFLTQIFNRTVIFGTPTILTWHGREDSSSKLQKQLQMLTLFALR